MATTFFIVPSPNADLAEWNALYVNPLDVRGPYVKVGRFVHKCIPLQGVARGTVCMNAIARRSVYPLDVVELEPFTPPVEPPKMVRIRAEYVKRISDPAPENLMQVARDTLHGSIVTVGQKFTRTHEGRPLLFEVTDIDATGIFDENTEVQVTWH